MFYRGGEDHHALTLLRKFNNLLDNMWSNTLLLFQFTVEVGLAEPARFPAPAND